MRSGKTGPVNFVGIYHISQTNKTVYPKLVCMNELLRVVSKYCRQFPGSESEDDVNTSVNFVNMIWNHIHKQYIYLLDNLMK